MKVMVCVLLAAAAAWASVSSPRQAAELVYSDLLGGSIEGKVVWSLPAELSAGQMVETWHEEIAAPFDGYLVLVDDMGLANWEHPCRWVFVSHSGDMHIVNMLTPPSAIQRMNQEYSDLPVPTQADLRQQILDWWVPNPRAGNDPAHTYAWIISGGYDSSNNHIRYYGDVQFFYLTITDDYGYTDDHIVVCFADGTNPAPDQSGGANSNPDLDGDGDTDIDFDATTSGVTSGYNAIAGMVGPNDHLVIFTTDHGGTGKLYGNNPPEVILNLWNMQTLDDDTFEGWLNTLSAASINVAMEQCYSGGFLEETIQGSGPRTFASAANGYESSWAGATYPQYDEWAYWWVGAHHGSVPPGGSYPGGALPGNPDMNSDGFVSYYEAAYRAEEWDSYASSGQEHPQWDDIPTSCGDSYYLGGAIGTGVGDGGFAPLAGSLACIANPFSSSAAFTFGLANPASVDLYVMDMSGRRVATLVDGEMAAGEHTVPWEAASIPSGIYIVRFSSEGAVETLRVVKF